MPPRGNSSGKELVTNAEAARRLGMTPVSIGQWAAKPGCPTHGAGAKRRLVWPDFPKWRDQELARQIRSEAKADSKPGDLEEAKARKMAAEAELAELELAKARGELIAVEDAVKEAEQVFERLRARLIAVPGKEAHRFVGLKRLPHAMKGLRDVIDTALTELSRDAGKAA